MEKLNKYSNRPHKAPPENERPYLGGGPNQDHDGIHQYKSLVEPRVRKRRLKNNK